MRACGSSLQGGSRLQRHHFAHENSQSSGPPCHLFAGLFHIFSLPVHHNTKHHLDSTTFSKTTLYTEHYFQNLYSRQAALTNRSRTSITRVAETRATPLPQAGYEPNEFATISGSSLEDIHQFYDVQRKFGEQYQQAPIIEEVKEFRQIGTQSFLDHEMAETSLVEKMSYLQSQMHLDESMESVADSDLEDGVTKAANFTTVCPKSFWETRCNGRSGERGKCTNVSFSSEDHRASGIPAALFSPKRNEQRNQMWNSVFGNANLWNLSGTLLEGNEDHLLSQA